MYTGESPAYACINGFITATKTNKYNRIAKSNV